MEYLSAEEEYELQYMDELEMLNEMQSSENDSIIQTASSVIPGDRNGTSTPDVFETHMTESIVKPTQISISSKRSFDDDDDSCSDNLPTPKKRKFYENDEPRHYLSTNLVTSKIRKSAHSGSVVPLPVTKLDGTVIYLNMHEDENEILNADKNVSQLLSTSVADLKMEILRKERLEAVARENAEHTSELQSCEISAQKRPGKYNLWVEKYKPKKFTDLLSDSGVNRVLLRWLKLWDKVVFGKEVNAPRKKLLDNKAFNKFRKPHMELNEDLDDHSRPMQKVALLCGPPGLGKTTLAGVIAEHAGYNVVELNASDDRSPDIFRRSLEAATQMKAVLDPDSRPNCLVIDEIDGTPAPSVELLVSFVKSAGYSKGKRKKGDIPLLLRPIVCICNDQYVSALKSLRQVALILNFPPTSKNRLVSRLHEVAQIEQLKTDLLSLDILCEKANNDIRSCLSTIQFLCTLKKEIRASDISKIEIGQKDIHKSLFSVWHDVFHVPREMEGRVKIDDETCKAYMHIDDESLKKRFSQTLRTVQGYGEYEKLFLGLFENYPNIKFRLTTMNTLCQGLEWMCFSDTIQQQIWQNQLFLLMPYLPFVGVAFNLLYAASAYPRLSYPSAFYECRTKRSQFLNVISSMVNEVIASAKNFFDTDRLILDVFPVLVEILKPNIRPINTQLYNAQEKAELKRVVDLMVALHLSYKQERSSDGQYDYILEPTIENLVSFSGVNIRTSLVYIVKQLISHEVNLEKLRQKCARDVVVQTKTTKEATKEEIKATSLSIAQKRFCAFFGKKAEKQSQTANIVKALPVTNQNSKEIIHDVWYHFNEGFCDAVKKTLFVKDMF